MTQPHPAGGKEGLYLSYSNCQKVHCGLRWDSAGGAIVGTDLDLVYITFDEYGDLVSAVSGKDGVTTDETGSIYHSGDDADGADSGDDERVTLNLFSMPRSIHYIFLAVEIRSNHTFDTVENPQIRLSKGLDEADLLNVRLGGRQGGDGKAFVFVRFDRTEGGWIVNGVNHYPEGELIPDWPPYLAAYLPEIEAAGKGADRPAIPARGEKVPLYYTREARHRIVCGLSWDARGEKATREDRRAERGGHNATTYDLDLTCLMFDADGAYLDYVTGNRAIDESGAVYHSGDDTTGAGGGDDEQVSVELLRVPEDVSHIVFVAEVKSLHRLGDIGNPTIRIADGKTDRNQLTARLDEGGDNNACIFARIVRNGDSWDLHYIGAYVNTADIEDWVEPISDYLA